MAVVAASAADVQAALSAATDRVLGYEDRLAAAATGVLRIAGRSAARKFADKAVLTAAAGDGGWLPPHPDELVDVDAIVSALRTKSDPIRRSAIANYGRALGDLHPDANWDVTNPLVGGALSGSAQHVTAIADTTRINLMRIIGASYEEGLTIEDTQKAIRQGMDAASKVRGRLIARTELAAVTNGGSLAATQILADATGDTYFKRWMTAPGAHYPRHEDYDGLDGQTVALDDHFDVGTASLRFPGDPDGPPEEICNCRCTLAYVSSPEEGEADVGITPFREGVDDPVGFYDSDKFRRFELDAARYADNFGVTIDEQERATGVWEGAEEPSVHFHAHDGDMGVQAFAAALGRAYRQDGVAIFDPGPGPDVIATFKATSATHEELFAAMAKEGLPAGRIADDGNLEIFGSGPEFVAQLERLSGDLGVEYDYYPGKFTLLERDAGDYEKAIGDAQSAEAGQARKAGRGAAELPGHAPLEEGAGGAEAGARPLVPGPGAGDAPMSDLLANDVYLPDVYDTGIQSRYYGTGDEQADQQSFGAINRARGNPDAEVKVYRGVSPGIDEIRPGELVTPSRSYAEDMAARVTIQPLEAERIAERGFVARGVVISKTVRAGDLYTDGNSINEWGWHPKVPAIPDGPRLDPIPDVSAPAPPTKWEPPYPPSEAARFGTDRLWGAHAQVGKLENKARRELPGLRDDQLTVLLWDKGLGKLPKDTLTFDDLAGDQQVHTFYSDGHNSVQQVADEAMKRGETQIVVSDHAHAMTTADIAAQHAEIDRLNERYAGRFKILKGIEANILADGTLDVAPEVLARFDVVNAAIHAHIQGPGGQLALFKEANTARLLRAMDNPELTVLVHPHAVGADWDAVAIKAERKGVALEVNGRDMLRNDSQEAAADMIAAAKRHGAKLVIGSDAHTTGDLVDFLYAARFAAQHGVTAEDLAPLARGARAGDPSSSIPASFDSEGPRSYKLGGGMNEVWKIDTEDGREFVVKPEPDPERFLAMGIDTENPLRSNIDPGRDLERERAAYVFSRLFNDVGDGEFKVNVPAYRLGELKGDGETVQAGIAEFISGQTPQQRGFGDWEDDLDPTTADQTIRSAGLFDAVIGNTDRHGGNWIVGDDGQLWLIDHGLTFPVGPGNGYDNAMLLDRAIANFGELLDASEVEFLERLSVRLGEVEPELERLLGPLEIEHLQQRIASMVETAEREPPSEWGGTA